MKQAMSGIIIEKHKKHDNKVYQIKTCHKY